MFMSKPFTGGFTYQISVAGGGEEGKGGEGCTRKHCCSCLKQFCLDLVKNKNKNKNHKASLEEKII